ncbi:hypothetical protein J6590_011419 [Homalodisca vitripennis]|nr:hypothetical protein J6590_011419 [Homalodisca vitripennis]
MLATPNYIQNLTSEGLARVGWGRASTKEVLMKWRGTTYPAQDAVHLVSTLVGFPSKVTPESDLDLAPRLAFLAVTRLLLADTRLYTSVLKSLPNKDCSRSTFFKALFDDLKSTASGSNPIWPDIRRNEATHHLMFHYPNNGSLPKVLSDVVLIAIVPPPPSHRGHRNVISLIMD